MFIECNVPCPYDGESGAASQVHHDGVVMRRLERNLAIAVAYAIDIDPESVRKREKDVGHWSIFRATHVTVSLQRSVPLARQE